jgi:hypothetical protein
LQQAEEHENFVKLIVTRDATYEVEEKRIKITVEMKITVKTDKQGRKRAYNVAPRRFRVTIVVVEKQQALNFGSSNIINAEPYTPNPGP